LGPQGQKSTKHPILDKYPIFSVPFLWYSSLIGASQIAYPDGLGGGIVNKLIIRYNDGQEASVVLPNENDEVDGFADLSAWIDINTALVELRDRTLLLLEQGDRVLTIPFQNIKHIEFATSARALTH
jgi:hypothetical protein